MKLKYFAGLLLVFGVFSQLGAWPSLSTVISGLKEKFSSQRPERTMMAPRYDVELCRRAVALQATSLTKPTRVYAALGGALGACAAVAKKCGNLRFWQYSKSLGLCAVTGAILGAVAHYFVQSYKIKHVFENASATLLSQEYMQQVGAAIQRNNGMDPEFAPSDLVPVSESEIKKWHKSIFNLFMFDRGPVMGRCIKRNRMFVNLQALSRDPQGPGVFIARPLSDAIIAGSIS